MIDGLTVTADELAFQSRAPLRRTDRIGIEFAQKKIQSREIGNARSRGIHGREDGATDLAGIREFVVGQQFQTRAEAAALNARERNIDAVGRGAAHHAGDDHPATSSAEACRRRSSSLNCQMRRVRRSTVFCFGVGAIGFVSAFDFFFSAEHALRFSRHQPGEFLVDLGLLQHGFKRPAHALFFLADQEHIGAGAQRFNRGVLDRRTLPARRPCRDRR